MVNCSSRRRAHRAGISEDGARGVQIQDGKFHIGDLQRRIGPFHVAAANPQYFRSVTAFPGYMWEPSPAKLQAISNMCVFMYVGEFDEYRWHGEMKAEAEFLRSRGTLARYTVEKGQPHRLETLAGANAVACSRDSKKPRRDAVNRNEPRATAFDD